MEEVGWCCRLSEAERIFLMVFWSFSLRLIWSFFRTSCRLMGGTTPAPAPAEAATMIAFRTLLVLRLCSLLSRRPSLMAVVLGDAGGDACDEESEDDKNEDDDDDGGGARGEESEGRSRNSSTSGVEASWGSGPPPIVALRCFLPVRRLANILSSEPPDSDA